MLFHIIGIEVINKMNKKLYLFVGLISISLIFILIQLIQENIPVTANENNHPKKECEEEYEKWWKELNRDILKDIVLSFDLDLTGYKEVRHEDLRHEKDMHDNEILTLRHMFVGNANGEHRLFILEDENRLKNQGYLLYKKNDGNNVMKIIRKFNDVWVVMSENEKESKRIEKERIDWSKCEEL
jgi:hypothetical protein